jgi:hypothetical protein
MLDDVERRALLPQPARENPLELALRVAHVELDEGAGQPLLLPGRGRFTGEQANHHVADPDRLARAQGEVALLQVALVEQMEDGHALGHRRGPGRNLGHTLVDRDDLGLALIARFALGRAAGAAGGERQRQGRGDEGRPPHLYSGVQAS